MNFADNDVKNDDKFKNDQQTPLLGHEKKLQKQTSTVGTGNSIKNYVLEQLSTLMTTCIVIRIYDLTIYKVTTTTRKPITKEFLTGKNFIDTSYFYYLFTRDKFTPLKKKKEKKKQINKKLKNF